MLLLLNIMMAIVRCITCFSTQQEDFDFNKMNYAVVVDAGSTGSRAFIFQYFHEVNFPDRVVVSNTGKKVKPGLSSFATEPSKATEYLLPVFVDAAIYIPPAYHAKTQVYIKGTAGMRLISEEQQDELWDSLLEGLNRHEDFVFQLDRAHLGTIDGRSEAFYAVLSSNYILGNIDSNLIPQRGRPLVGALDMGGSSTQLVFYTGSLPEEPVREAHFWSHSWLNYGVERIRQKAWRFVVEGSAHLAVGDGISAVTPLIISNPCTFLNHEDVTEEGFILRGTGDADACMAVIKNVIWPGKEYLNCSLGEPCFMDGAVHPPLFGDFYGLSVYFYAIDCLRHYVPEKFEKWPQPSVNELESASHAFCAMPWDDVRVDVESPLREERRHQYTADDQLAHRCVEGLYISTLLKYAFAFGGNARNITVALDVEGSEVEWTLGFALTGIIFPYWTVSSGNVTSVDGRGGPFVQVWSRRQVLAAAEKVRVRVQAVEKAVEIELKDMRKKVQAAWRILFDVVGLVKAVRERVDLMISAISRFVGRLVKGFAD